MKHLKDSIGVKSKFYEEQIDAERLARFSSAAGSTEIPTFATCFRAGEFELMTKLGIELKQVLHAEQDYTFLEPILAGNKVRYQTVLSDVHEKKSKDTLLHFMVYETDLVRSDDGAVLVHGKSLIAYREKLDEAVQS